MMDNNNRPKIGLALSSGSARGFAHIGVIKALLHHGVPIDCVCGSSIGAIVGGIYAAGTDLGMLESIVTNMSTRSIFDFSMPQKGLLKGEKFAEIIKTLTKDKTFAELNIPFSCAACDIINGKSDILSNGKVYRAIRASMSVPGMFRPYTIDGTMYVDGGVLNPVPVDGARALGAEYVIAVDVRYRGGKETIKPTALQVLLRTFDLMAFEASRCQSIAADAIILPQVQHTKKYTNANAEECIRIGYEETAQKIIEIQADIERLSNERRQKIETGSFPLT